MKKTEGMCSDKQTDKQHKGGPVQRITSPPAPVPAPNLHPYPVLNPLRMPPRHQPLHPAPKWNPKTKKNSKIETKSAWITHSMIRPHPHRIQSHTGGSKTPTKEKTKGEITSGRFNGHGDLQLKSCIPGVAAADEEHTSSTNSLSLEPQYPRFGEEGNKNRQKSNKR